MKPLYFLFLAFGIFSCLVLSKGIVEQSSLLYQQFYLYRSLPMNQGQILEI